MLIDKLRELDKLQLGVGALRASRRDLIEQAATGFPLLEQGIRSHSDQFVTGLVKPLLETNRRLAADRTACSGEKFEQMVAKLHGDLKQLLPVHVTWTDTTWRYNSLLDAFDASLAWKEMYKFTKNIILPLLVMFPVGLPLFSLGVAGGPDAMMSLKAALVLDAVLFVFFLLTQASVFTGSAIKRGIQGRLSAVDRVEKDATYLDHCITDAFS